MSISYNEVSFYPFKIYKDEQGRLVIGKSKSKRSARLTIDDDIRMQNVPFNNDYKEFMTMDNEGKIGSTDYIKIPGNFVVTFNTQGNNIVIPKPIPTDKYYLSVTLVGVSENDAIHLSASFFVRDNVSTTLKYTSYSKDQEISFIPSERRIVIPPVYDQYVFEVCARVLHHRLTS